MLALPYNNLRRVIAFSGIVISVFTSSNLQAQSEPDDAVALDAVEV